MVLGSIRITRPTWKEIGPILKMLQIDCRSSSQSQVKDSLHTSAVSLSAPKMLPVDVMKNMPVIQGNVGGLSEKVRQYIWDCAETCRPDKIFICDGSEEESQSLISKMVQEGMTKKLSKYQNWYVFNVARQPSWLGTDRFWEALWPWWQFSGYSSARSWTEDFIPLSFFLESFALRNFVERCIVCFEGEKNVPAKPHRNERLCSEYMHLLCQPSLSFPTSLLLYFALAMWFYLEPLHSMTNAKFPSVVFCGFTKERVLGINNSTLLVRCESERMREITRNLLGEEIMRELW